MVFTFQREIEYILPFSVYFLLLYCFLVFIFLLLFLGVFAFCPYFCGMITLRIKEIAKIKGLTLRAVAAGVGVSPQYLSAYISGRVAPSFPMLEKLANILGVSVAELFAPPAPPSVVCPHCGGAVPLDISTIHTNNNKEKK